MARMIDQIRASRLPSNMMQFAARGALQVPPAENIEILVYLAKYNKVFGELARMTLAGWDEKASMAVAADPETAQEVLNYLISVDNLRPKLLPRLLENPSVREEQVIKLATSALRDIIEIMLHSKRVRSSKDVIAALKSNPYLKREEAAELENSMDGAPQPVATPTKHSTNTSITSGASANDGLSEPAEFSHESETSDATFGVEDESVFAYFKEHADDIAAEGEKPFQAIGGIVDMFLPGVFRHRWNRGTCGGRIGVTSAASAGSSGLSCCHASHSCGYSYSSSETTCSAQARKCTSENKLS